VIPRAHYCGHPGCGALAHYGHGKAPLAPGDYVWRCRAHDPDRGLGANGAAPPIEQGPLDLFGVPVR
jgi:hypothetical protein